MTRKHWTQRSQSRRPFGMSISDEGGGTWQRGYGAEDKKLLEEEGFNFVGFTDPKTGIRRGIFGATTGHQEALIDYGFKRVKFNASIRDRDVKRDYKFNQFTSKKGFIFNKPVYRLKK